MPNKAPDQAKQPRDAEPGGSTTGRRHLVIVESPAKARTINKYLGPGYIVKASVGHIRDLPKRNPKGVKAPVPGIDLDNDFQPEYVPIEGKQKALSELKRAARDSDEVWLATDLDREGEAIAWHLAQSLGVDEDRQNRVVFNAITRQAIERAFADPRRIDMDKVNAQQARRILDRIVGYQVSPLLWKKVAGGLSAGRVQSVAVAIVVDREREIRAHVPDESWQVTVRLALDPDTAAGLVPLWQSFRSSTDDRGRTPTRKQQNAWLAEQRALKTELVEFEGEKFVLGCAADDPRDLGQEITRVVEAVGLVDVEVVSERDEAGKGPAEFRRTLRGELDPNSRFRIKSIETTRTSSKPHAPFITSTLQMTASSQLGFPAGRTMRAAQQLYEGIDLGAEGQVGLITYMRTDSTHLAPEAVTTVREWIGTEQGDRYLPEQPRSYGSSNRDAQEAHEAIRPNDVALTPRSLKGQLGDDQWKLYDLIWRRFVASQMVNAEWDATGVLFERSDRPTGAVLKATGRVLVFDGFLAVAGTPTASDEQVLPQLDEGHVAAPFDVEPQQKFSSSPSRYNEGSLIKKLEEEGIGRPSTYASIIRVIQDRRYVEKDGSRFRATDLGEVVTDKLREGFPKIMDVGYTRWMEQQLDEVEDGNTDWVSFLHEFHGPFQENLQAAHEQMSHAKAETQPAPKEYACPECRQPTEYRFGRNGKFLGCTGFKVAPKPSGVDCPECGEAELGVHRGKTERARPFLLCPDCDHKLTWSKLSKKQREPITEIAATLDSPCRYVAPIDSDGRPIEPELTEVACPEPECGEAMTRRTGRFGPFLSCSKYPDCKGAVNLDKKTGCVKLPKPPPLLTDLRCPKCDEPLNLRSGKRGPWLGCSKFPRCKGRQAWSKLEDAVKDSWTKTLKAHDRELQPPPYRTIDGKLIGEGYQPGVQDAEDAAETDVDQLAAVGDADD